MGRGKGAPEIVAPQEADLWIEVVTDEQVVELERIAVAVVGEHSLIAGVVTREAGGLGAGVVAVEVDVVVKGECRIDAVDLVRATTRRRDRPAGEDAADPAASQDVALDAQNREVGGGQADAGRIVRLDVHGPDAELACFARQPTAAQNGHCLTAFQPDPAAEEHGRHVTAAGEATSALSPCPSAAAAPATAEPRSDPEVEDAAALEEALALLGEEEAKPREVHLLLVNFDLGEIGVYPCFPTLKL